MSLVSGTVQRHLGSDWEGRRGGIGRRPFNIYICTYIYIYIYTKMSSSSKLVQASLQTLTLSLISRRCQNSQHRCITMPLAQGTDVHYATCRAIGGDASSLYMHIISNIMMDIDISIYIYTICVIHRYDTIRYSRSATTAVPEDRLRGGGCVCARRCLWHTFAENTPATMKHSIHRIRTEKLIHTCIYTVAGLRFINSVILYNNMIP